MSRRRKRPSSLGSRATPAKKEFLERVLAEAPPTSTSSLSLDGLSLNSLHYLWDDDEAPSSGSNSSNDENEMPADRLLNDGQAKRAPQSTAATTITSIPLVLDPDGSMDVTFESALSREDSTMQDASNGPDTSVPSAVEKTSSTTETSTVDLQSPVIQEWKTKLQEASEQRQRLSDQLEALQLKQQHRLSPKDNNVETKPSISTKASPSLASIIKTPKNTRPAANEQSSRSTSTTNTNNTSSVSKSVRFAASTKAPKFEIETPVATEAIPRTMTPGITSFTFAVPHPTPGTEHSSPPLSTGSSPAQTPTWTHTGSSKSSAVSVTSLTESITGQSQQPTTPLPTPKRSLFEDPATPADTASPTGTATPSTSGSSTPSSASSVKLQVLQNRNKILQEAWEQQQGHDKELKDQLAYFQRLHTVQQDETKKELSRILWTDKKAPSSSSSKNKQSMSYEELYEQWKQERDRRMELQIQCQIWSQQVEDSHQQSETKGHAQILKDVQEQHAQQIKDLNRQHQVQMHHVEEKYKQKEMDLVQTQKQEQVDWNLERVEIQQTLLHTQRALDRALREKEILQQQQQELIEASNKTNHKETAETTAKVVLLESALDQTTHELEQAQMEQQSLQMKIEHSKQQRKELQEALDATCTELENANKEIQQLQEQCEHQQGEMEEVQLHLQASQQALQDTQKELEDLQTKHDDLQRTLEETQEELGQVQEAAIDAERALEQSQAELDETQEGNAKVDSFSSVDEELEPIPEYEGPPEDTEEDSAIVDQSTDSSTVRRRRENMMQALERDFAVEFENLERQLEEATKEVTFLSSSSVEISRTLDRDDNDESMRLDQSIPDTPSKPLGAPTGETLALSPILPISGTPQRDHSTMGQDNEGVERLSFSSSQSSTEAESIPHMESHQSDGSALNISRAASEKIEALIDEIGILDVADTSVMEAVAPSSDHPTITSQERSVDIASQDMSTSLVKYQSNEDSFVAPKNSTRNSRSMEETSVLDITLDLLHQMKDLMRSPDATKKDSDGEPYQLDDKEKSVLEKLEVLSDIMGESLTASQNLSLSLLEQHHQQLSMDENGANHQIVETSLEADESLPANETTLVSNASNSGLVDAADTRSFTMDAVAWMHLVEELKRQIAFVEHDRDEIIRITQQMMDQAKEAHEVELQILERRAYRKGYEEAKEDQTSVPAFVLDTVCHACYTKLGRFQSDPSAAHGDYAMPDKSAFDWGLPATFSVEPEM